MVAGWGSAAMCSARSHCRAREPRGGQGDPAPCTTLALCGHQPLCAALGQRCWGVPMRPPCPTSSRSSGLLSQSTAPAGAWAPAAVPWLRSSPPGGDPASRGRSARGCCSAGPHFQLLLFLGALRALLGLFASLHPSFACCFPELTVRRWLAAARSSCSLLWRCSSCLVFCCFPSPLPCVTSVLSAPGPLNWVLVQRGRCLGSPLNNLLNTEAG